MDKGASHPAPEIFLCETGKFSGVWLACIAREKCTFLHSYTELRWSRTWQNSQVERVGFGKRTVGAVQLLQKTVC